MIISYIINPLLCRNIYRDPFIALFFAFWVKEMKLIREISNESDYRLSFLGTTQN